VAAVRAVEEPPQELPADDSASHSLAPTMPVVAQRGRHSQPLFRSLFYWDPLNRFLPTSVAWHTARGDDPAEVFLLPLPALTSWNCPYLSSWYSHC
jgi:hypothetical protein